MSVGATCFTLFGSNCGCLAVLAFFQGIFRKLIFPYVTYAKQKRNLPVKQRFRSYKRRGLRQAKKLPVLHQRKILRLAHKKVGGMLISVIELLFPLVAYPGMELATLYPILCIAAW